MIDHKSVLYAIKAIGGEVLLSVLIRHFERGGWRAQLRLLIGDWVVHLYRSILHLYHMTGPLLLALWRTRLLLEASLRSPTLLQLKHLLISGHDYLKCE